MIARSHRLAVLAASAAIVGALIALPVGFDTRQGPSFEHAWAGNGHGNGNGHSNSNGNGGGNSNGNGGGNGNANAGGNSNGSSGTNDGNGGAEGGSASADAGNDTTGGAAGLGSLSAAHASASAFANASPNSEVGRIRAYGEALDRYRSDVQCGAACSGDLPADITDMALALAAASNKTLTVDTLDDLNGLLGQSTAFDAAWEGTTAPDIVDQANAAK